MDEPPSAVPVDISLTTHGARIIDDEQPRCSRPVGDDHDIYLPNHLESVSQIAIDIGGSLAKVVYFTHSSHAQACPRVEVTNEHQIIPQRTLTPTVLHRQPDEPSDSALKPALASSFDPRKLRRRSLPERFPGGRLNFVKFETSDIQSCVKFLQDLISKSAQSNHVSLQDMQRSVKVAATGGGAHLFYDLIEKQLGVEVVKEDEMHSLITGLNFMTLIPDEVFYYSDEQVNAMYQTHHLLNSNTMQRGDSSVPGSINQDLPRPSPHPPLYTPMFEREPSPKVPCLLVNIGSGVSILKVDETGHFERVSGTSLGGGTLWGILGLLTDAQSFDEMLEMSVRGNNSNVDMLVGDIYGPVGLDHLGLKASTIASSFGKVFRRESDEDHFPKDPSEQSARRRSQFRQEDICRSLLYAISNNIGQIAHLNAEKYKLDRVYFGGSFIRGHQATISTLSYAIRFWSRGRRRAYFLRHEGYLGAVGAWVRHNGNEPSFEPTTQKTSPSKNQNQSQTDSKHLTTDQVRGGDRMAAEHSSPKALVPSQSEMNPILAEALGDMYLDAPTPESQQATPIQPVPTSKVSSDDLLENLQSLDEQSLEEDPDSIAKVMEQLDQANLMADAIETRVNSLLGKLQELMPETTE
ncbi:pantothenate kinase [Malassezia yamatoensis]|uniref:Pantothenate kinase n=1 Tax=Malassezia yamatoensis TaxID=253288 RepID=A0AAJ5YUM9_9BASI|nr:pantothenate kinase [Malassezia yamatoensis]